MNRRQAGASIGPVTMAPPLIDAIGSPAVAPPSETVGYTSTPRMLPV